jgi:hypothetical protein
MKRKDALRIAGTFGLLAMMATGCGIDRMSVATDGSRANGTESYAHPALGASGLEVAFESNATNLVSDDTNGAKDVFIRETTSATQLGRTPRTERVSVATGGAEANGDSSWPSIDDSSSSVVFESNASNLVDGDTNAVPDIFLRDNVLHKTTRISVASDGSELTPGTFKIGSRRPVISGNGRYVAFLSDATNTGSGLDAAAVGLYVRDLQQNTTTFVGLVGENSAQNVVVPDRAAVSNDGNIVAYAQRLQATTQLPDRTDVSVVDRSAGTSEFVTSKDDPYLSSSLPSLSGDGRFVSFAQKNSYGQDSMWVLDRLNHSYGAVANVSPTGAPVLSGDGGYLAFSAKARPVTQLAGTPYEYKYWTPTDQAEIYRVDRQTGAVKWITAHLDNAAYKLATSQSPAINADGSKIAFTSTLYKFTADTSNTSSEVVTWTDKK